VLREVQEHVLTPQAVENFLLAVDERTSQSDERRARLEKELGDVKRREAALVAAVEGGGSDVTPIIERMKSLEGRRIEIEHELKAATPAPRLETRVLESRLAEWRRILRGSVTQARDVLQRVIRGKLRFTQLPGGIIQFEGESRYSWLSSGIFVGVPDTTPVPPHIAALGGDTRGHEGIDEERAEMEARYEAVLRGAERSVRGTTLAGFEPAFSTLKGFLGEASAGHPSSMECGH